MKLEFRKDPGVRCRAGLVSAFLSLKKDFKKHLIPAGSGIQQRNPTLCFAGWHKTGGDLEPETQEKEQMKVFPAVFAFREEFLTAEF